MKKIKNILLIQLTFLIYSLSSLFSKLSGTSSSVTYQIVFYAFCLGFLFIFAFLWQRILQKNSLIYSYINKSVTIIWGLIFGYFIFNETITFNMIIGIIIALFGTVLILTEDGKI